MTLAETTPLTPDLRIFLVVVDNSAEMLVALYYAARRARRTGGRVALLHVTPEPDTHGLRSVEDLIREEARREAEMLVNRLAKDVQDWTGTMPVLYMREGDRREVLIEVIAEEPSISILVLAASTGPEGPGPLVTHLSKTIGKLRVPVTLVPGSLTRVQMDSIT